jgi:glycosyltransferase involved in cell wall biosynthesis
MTNRKISVIIACYNSSSRIKPTLRSLEEQVGLDLGNDVEVLLIHGDSNEGRTRIASSLNLRHFENPSKNAIAAKHIGIVESKSDFLVFLDHDEILSSPTSLVRKKEYMEREENLKIIFTSGYVTTTADAASNLYASIYGDPINSYLYRTPNDIKNRKRTLLRSFKRRVQTAEFIRVQAISMRRPILLEALAQGCMVRSSLIVRNSQPEVNEANLYPHLFYTLKSESDLVGFLQNDPVVHQSAESWSVILRKNRWRIGNAIFDTSNLKKAGVMGREDLLSIEMRNKLRLRKYLLLIKAALVFPILIDTFILCLKYRKIGLSMHFFLVYYDAWIVGLYKIMKVIKIEKKEFAYTK